MHKYLNVIYVEDGTETFNNFEHNMGICTIPTKADPYLNPIPIIGNISADICWPSVIWIKNNMNTCFRNVFCCSPVSYTHLTLPTILLV